MSYDTMTSFDRLTKPKLQKLWAEVKYAVKVTPAIIGMGVICWAFAVIILSI